MAINYIGLLVLIIGLLFFALAVVQPEKFIIYRILKARATPCVGEGNEYKWIAVYSIAMVVFGGLLMFRVFGAQDGVISDQGKED